MVNRQTSRSPRQNKAQSSKTRSALKNSQSRNNAPQLAALLAAGAGAGEISQLAAALSAGGVGSNLALLSIAEQQSVSREAQSDTCPVFSEGIPQFGDTLPENDAPMGSFSCCQIPADAQSLPTAELSWFGG